VLNVLFSAADLGANFVIRPWDAAHAFGLLGLIDALRFDRGSAARLIRERLLHPQFALAHRAVLHFSAAVDLAQAQCQELGGQASLGFLQYLVAARSGGLTLQVTDLLVDFVAHVLQPFEVLRACRRCAPRFPCGALVPGDAGGFFAKRACPSAFASMTREIMPCSMMA